jgi:hypothetical protein
MENRILIRSGYVGAAGVFVVIDPTRPDSLRSGLEYLTWMKDMQPGAICYCLFNKCDLRQSWLPQNTPEPIRTSRYFITSAKTGEGVEDAFREMARSILSKILPADGAPARAAPH